MRTAITNPTAAHAIAKKARTMDSMTNEIVPEVTDDHEAVVRRQRWALPLLTVSWLLLGTILVASVIQIERWELAPGEAQRVAPRMEFEGSNGTAAPKRYPARNQIRFVTAFGGQITALDSFVGWIDPHVNVDTYTQRFGERTPSSERKIAFQAMFGAKQIAEYVAMRRLGYDARFIDGPIFVEDVVCEEAPSSTSACKVLQIGDRITAFNGTAVEHVADLAPLMKGREAGTSVTLSVVPDGETKPVTRMVTLIVSPDDATRVIIGFIPADTRSVELPFEVSINTVDIGGPSAGLAFTLALLDELSPGELLGKTAVAATGTIDETGAIGAIGALTQKAIAVRDAGAKVFLVPAGQSVEEIAAAQKAAGSGVRIIPVATLDEALKALEKLGGDALGAPTQSMN